MPSIEDSDKYTLLLGGLPESTGCRLPARARWKSYKLSLLWLGALIGFFVQCQSLFAYFLVAFIMSPEVLDDFQDSVVYFDLIWAFTTSAIATYAIFCLMALFWDSIKTFGLEDSALEDIWDRVKYWCLAGIIIGDWLANIMALTLLGISEGEVVESIASLLVLLLLGRVAVWCFDIVSDNNQSAANSAGSVATIV